MPHESWDEDTSQNLDALVQNNKISDWEGEFVDSVVKQRDDGRPCSDKQKSLINKIHKEREA